MASSKQLLAKPFRKSTTRQSATRKGQCGVLLLEVLISILIFSFAFLGIVALQARAVQFSVEGEDRNRAALMVNEMVSTMWAQKTTISGNLAGEITAWQSRVQDPTKSGLPNANATVGLPDANGVVTVSVTWTPVADASSTHSYQTQIVMP